MNILCMPSLSCAVTEGTVTIQTLESITEEAAEGEREREREIRESFALQGSITPWLISLGFTWSPKSMSEGICYTVGTAETETRGNLLIWTHLRASLLLE